MAAGSAAVATAPATPPEPKPAVDLAAEPNETYLGPKGSTHYYQNDRGMKLCSYFWPAQGQPKAIVVLTHGHGSYLCFDYLRSSGAGEYTTYEGSWVQALNAAGYSLCGIDNQGAGRSEGLRCYCDHFDDYVADVIKFTSLCTSLDVAGFDTSLPKFMMGASMGGCTALTTALQAEGAFAGVIGLAPMVSLEKVAKQGLNPYLRPLGSLLSYMVPKLAACSTNKNTNFPDLQLAYDMDPNCYHDKTRVRSAYEYLLATERLMRQAERLTCPLLIFHADGDTQTDPEGSKRLVEKSKSVDKTLVVPPKMWHILMKEPGNEAVLAQVLEWLNEHAVGGAKHGAKAVDVAAAAAT